MTKVVGASATDTAGLEAAGARPEQLRRFRGLGYWLLGIQLAVFMAWSAILYSHFAITSDYSFYHQAWYLIAHGDLDPRSSIMPLQYWRSDSEFVLWPLAPLYWIWPHDLLLQWAQDASVAGAEAVAFTWLCEIIRDRWPGRRNFWIAAVGLAALLANPWIWWTVSFDVHEEALIVVFVALLARDLVNGRRRAWAWVVPILAGGAPSASYVIGLGLCGLFAGRRARVMGLTIAAIGVAYSLFVVFIHGDTGVPLARHYGYLAAVGGSGANHFLIPNVGLKDVLKGAIEHPSGLYRELWRKNVDIWANLAPSGLIGVLSPIVFPAILIVILANGLSPGYQFVEPLFQNVPIYVLLPVGTVAVLCWIGLRNRRVALLLAGLVLAQTLGWAAVWARQTPREWLRVPGSTAATLARLDARIPRSDEVIVSQGVAGRFSGRADVQPMLWPGPMSVSASEVWFVVLPFAGIETLSTASSMALIDELAGKLHATLVTQANGVWAFRWHRPARVHEVTVPGGSMPLQAWGMAGIAGHSVMSGHPRTWHVAATGRKGYVVDRLEWIQSAGHYRVNVRLAADGPVNVEIWNDTSRRLLAKRSIVPTPGEMLVSLSVEAGVLYHNTRFSGWGPFRADFVPPPPGERLEVRVWSPGKESVNVYNAWIVRERTHG